MMLNSRRWKRTWWLGGFGLVLALLGHDGLMATVAHVAPLSSQATATHERAPTHQPIAVAADRDEEPHPTHPTTCGVAGVAAPCPSYQFDLDDLSVLEAISAPDLRAAALLSVRHWDEPFWPPGTLRALLQVYRI